MACPAPLSTASISVPPDRLLAMTPLCKGLVRATRPKWCTIRAWASAYATSSRPFNVLGIQQIAIGGLSKPALAALWVDEFGLRRIGNYRSEKENVDEDILSLGTGPWAVEVDLMQPIDPDKAPKVHVPPLNHIGLWVDDLPRAVESLTASGLRFAPGGIRRGASGYDITFLHPKSSEKVCRAVRSGGGPVRKGGAHCTTSAQLRHSPCPPPHTITQPLHLFPGRWAHRTAWGSVQWACAAGPFRAVDTNGRSAATRTCSTTHE